MHDGNSQTATATTTNAITATASSGITVKGQQVQIAQFFRNITRKPCQFLQLGQIGNLISWKGTKQERVSWPDATSPVDYTDQLPLVEFQ